MQSLNFRQSDFGLRDVIPAIPLSAESVVKINLTEGANKDAAFCRF